MADLDSRAVPAGERLADALRGRGAFRRFKDRVHQRHPQLVSSWDASRDVRAQRRAVEWLLGEGLIDQDAADGFADTHPDPDLR